MKMRGVEFLYLVVAALVLIGCPSPEEEYIADHAAVSIGYESDEHEITLLLENPEDANPEVMPDLLWVQKHINETVLPDDEVLKYVVIFIPATEESYEAVCPERTRGCIQVFAMVEGRIIVTFTPDRWKADREDVVATYIHELVHYVSYKTDGSGDGTHLKYEYWGKHGLVSSVLVEHLAVARPI